MIVFIEALSHLIDVLISIKHSKLHCAKSDRIRSFSSPYFLAFGQNTLRCGVSLHTQSECGKIRTRKTPNTDTYHAVLVERNTSKIRFLKNKIIGI